MQVHDHLTSSIGTSVTMSRGVKCMAKILLAAGGSRVKGCFHWFSDAVVLLSCGDASNSAVGWSIALAPSELWGNLWVCVGADGVVSMQHPQNFCRILQSAGVADGLIAVVVLQGLPFEIW